MTSHRSNDSAEPQRRRAHAEVGLLLGEALHELGRFEEAEDVLVAAEGVASADHPL